MPIDDPSEARVSDLASPTVTATFVSTPESVMKSYHACHPSALRGRVAVVVVLAGVSALITRSAAGVLLGLVWGLAYVVVNVFLVRRQLRPYLAGERIGTVVISPDGYRVQGQDRWTDRSWSTFTSVRRVGDFWVLRVSRAMAMALPVDALDADQTETFLAIARSNGLCE